MNGGRSRRPSRACQSGCMAPASSKRGSPRCSPAPPSCTPSDAQEMDDLNPMGEKTYLHHSTFPPISVGEPGRCAPPPAGEVGHGALAERP